jgi:HD-GYP domain-containing protein (c-di-GMP phosphodiesterase class II)
LTRFHLILKIIRIYEAENSLVQEHVGPLYRALTLLLHAEGAASLRVHHSAFFFNQTRIRFEVANQTALKFLTAEFEARGISAIAFSEGLAMDELSRFVGALAGKPSGQPGAFERSVKRLEEARISHISLEAIPADAGEAGLKARAARVYMLGIRMLYEVIDRQKRKGGFSLTVPRRWMQAMIRYLDEDESFCLGLTMLKHAEGYHANHGVNVAVLATALGRRLGLPRNELAELGVSALTHDLGTLEVAPAILDKPAELTEAERALFDKQALLGAQKLIPMQGGRSLPIKSLEVVMEHRLLMDQSNRGTGGSRRSIHLFSRIVRIADAYDALTTKRVYRPHTFTPASALKLMAGKSGVEFDPLLFKAFNAMLGPFPVGSLVALDDGSIGVVIESNPRLGLASRPKTRLIADAEGRKKFGPILDLAERTPDGRRYKRTIALALNADAYGIRPVDYFLASAR